MSRDRPRITIVCDGSDTRRHRPAIVALYAMDSDGTMMPIHSAVRIDGKPLILPESGLRPVAGQFDWPCPNRRCPFVFRAPVEAVTAALLRLSVPEVSLREIEHELRHTDA